VPKIPRNYFTGSHRVTLDHGDYFALFTLFSIRTRTRDQTVGLPLSAVSTYLVARSSFKDAAGETVHSH
jgi:hypothetical protein